MKKKIWIDSNKVLKTRGEITIDDVMDFFHPNESLKIFKKLGVDSVSLTIGNDDSELVSMTADEICHYIGDDEEPYIYDNNCFNGTRRVWYGPQ